MAVYGPEGAKAESDRINSLKANIRKLTGEIATLNAQIYGLARTYIGEGGIWTSAAKYNDYLILTAKRDELQKKRAADDFTLRFLQNQNKTTNPPAGSTSGTGGTSTQTDTTTQTLGSVTGDLEYNVPAVKEAYFKDNMSFFDYNTWNQPRKAVADARDLWTNGIASKGMFQTWSPPNGVQTNEFIDGFDIDNRLGGRNWQKYGFQFLYNPGNISMSYSGNVDVDISLMLSGREKFNPVSTNATQSTISFEILLNRMFDMKYYDKDTGRLQNGQNPYILYGARIPKAKDQTEIFNKGTMYDVEFLLKTLFGFEVPSQLGRGKTADMGFVIPRPVELHLGNKLRYLVYVNGFSLNHVIFDSRMVPLFTTLSILANRVPDYGGELAVDGSGV